MAGPSRELGRGGGQRGSHRLENGGTVRAINPPWAGKGTEAQRRVKPFSKKLKTSRGRTQTLSNPPPKEISWKHEPHAGPDTHSDQVP